MEEIYLDHNNIINRQLLKDDVIIDFADYSFDRMVLVIDDLQIESDNEETDPILWDKVGYSTGEIRISIGDQLLIPRHTPYMAYLVIYDADNPNGVVWDKFLIKVNPVVVD